MDRGLRSTTATLKSSVAQAMSTLAAIVAGLIGTGFVAGVVVTFVLFA